MTSTTVSIPFRSAENVSRIGPALIEHRTASTGFEQLGTYVMTYDQEGHSDPWTLQYEESIYVVNGQLDLRAVAEDGSETAIVADPGQIVALAKGSTVRYGATVGTTLILSISPVNWRAAAS